MSSDLWETQAQVERPFLHFFKKLAANPIQKHLRVFLLRWSSTYEYVIWEVEPEQTCPCISFLDVSVNEKPFFCQAFYGEPCTRPSLLRACSSGTLSSSDKVLGGGFGPIKSLQIQTQQARGQSGPTGQGSFSDPGCFSASRHLPIAPPSNPALLKEEARQVRGRVTAWAAHQYCLCPLRGPPGQVQCRRPGFNLWVGKIPWRRKWLPALLFLPRESP